jgi:zinc transporter 9
LVALKELRGVSKKWNISKIIKDGDPATLAVLYEDGIAVLGVMVALASITLTYLTGKFYWDAIGSIIIGLMLALVAVILIDKNRKFLIEKSIPDELKDQIIEALESEPAIEKVMDFKSSILDVGIFRIKCEVEFNGAALLKEMYKKKVLREEYESIKDDYDEFMRFFAENVDRIPRVMGKKIDEIEKNIQKKFPAIKHLDIEIN